MWCLGTWEHVQSFGESRFLLQALYQPCGGWRPAPCRCGCGSGSTWKVPLFGLWCQAERMCPTLSFMMGKVLWAQFCPLGGGNWGKWLLFHCVFNHLVWGRCPRCKLPPASPGRRCPPWEHWPRSRHYRGAVSSILARIPALAGQDPAPSRRLETSRGPFPN